MNIFNEKHIIVGITGSIAAYKAPLLIRDLIKEGAIVHVIMTPAAVNFVTPMTLANLSRNPVTVDMFDSDAQKGGAWHIHVAHSCDAMIIAPCSASTLGKIANGICDNALVTVATALPRNIPLLIAPAMDSTMWLHPSIQHNASTLKNYGIIIIPPEEGNLSSGFTGPGRLPDIPVLLKYLSDAIQKKHAYMDETKPFIHNFENTSSEQIHINQNFSESPSELDMKIKDKLSIPINSLSDAVEKDKWSAELELTKLKNSSQHNFFKDKKILITAGPTIEKIDDVRYISNYSSGKMGYAIAAEAQQSGAQVILISGHVKLEPPEGVQFINVETSKEMYDSVLSEFPKVDIAIMAAAVADFTPINKFQGKLKKSDIGDVLTLRLEPTKDILAAIGSKKTSNQTIVGFALESINEIENGWQKLKAKNCDMIVVNSASKPNSGFGGDDNIITILTKDGKEESYSQMSKQSCSKAILQKISDISK